MKDLSLTTGHFFNYKSGLEDLQAKQSLSSPLFLCPFVSSPDKRRKRQPNPSAAGPHRYRELLGNESEIRENGASIFSQKPTMGARQVGPQAVH